jgi:phosphohistidine phosphatase
MKRLILVRHATAVDKGPEGSDFHRRLKKRGKREAMLMADRVAAIIDVPDQVYSSPADRALETAQLFAERLGIPAERVALREELYGGLEPEEFLHIVQRFDDRAKNVMVFGHDPSFTEFASYMIPVFGKPIPKAGVLVMEIDRARWREVRAGDARAAHFEKPPAHAEQKRVDDDLIKRLVTAISSGILAGVRDFGLGDSSDLTRMVERASRRLARDMRPFVRTTAPKKGPPASAAKAAAKAGTGKRTRRRSA